MVSPHSTYIGCPPLLAGVKADLPIHLVRSLVSSTPASGGSTSAAPPPVPTSTAPAQPFGGFPMFGAQPGFGAQQQNPFGNNPFAAPGETPYIYTYYIGIYTYAPQRLCPDHHMPHDWRASTVTSLMRIQSTTAARRLRVNGSLQLMSDCRAMILREGV